eukprot:1633412-Rhodomonas_salina.2
MIVILYYHHDDAIVNPPPSSVTLPIRRKRISSTRNHLLRAVCTGNVVACIHFRRSSSFKLQRVNGATPTRAVTSCSCASGVPWAQSPRHLAELWRLGCLSSCL